MVRRESHRLAILLAERLKKAGFSWTSLDELGLDKPVYYWERPSTYEPRALLGEEPCVYQLIGLRQPLCAWSAVYDQHLEVLSEGGPAPTAKVLVDEMGLPNSAQRLMLPGKGPLPPRGAWYLPLVGFAALAKGALLDSMLIVDTPTEFTATHESGVRFGVARGVPVWNKPGKFKRSYGLAHPKGLRKLLVPQGTQRRKPGVFDNIRTWVERHPAQFRGDMPDVLTALSVVCWAYRSVLPKEMQDLLYVGKDVTLAYAVEYAKQFRDFANPRAMMLEVLVPEHMTKGKFRWLFGDGGMNGHPLHEQVILRWDSALELLHPSTKQ